MRNAGRGLAVFVLCECVFSLSGCWRVIYTPGMFERAVCHRYCFYYTLCQVLTAGCEALRRVDAAAISIIEIIIMLTSFLSGGRAEKMSGGGGGFVTVAICCPDGRRRALSVIGIMGWFSGGSDAFDGILDETGANFTSDSCLSVCFIVKSTSLSSSFFISIKKNKNKKTLD